MYALIFLCVYVSIYVRMYAGVFMFEGIWKINIVFKLGTPGGRGFRVYYNSSSAKMKNTKLFFQTPFATGPEDSPEDILRRFENKRVLSVSALGWRGIDCFVILSSSILTTGLARASTALTQATGRLYLHLQRFGITLLATVFLLFFNTCLDYRPVP